VPRRRQSQRPRGGPGDLGLRNEFPPTPLTHAEHPAEPSRRTGDRRGDRGRRPGRRRRFGIAGSRSLLEVFTSFKDATGADASLELYVAVDEEAAAWDAARPVVAVTVAGLLVLALATLPASLAYARRAARRDAEQRAARGYAFAAAETARQEAASALHEGVIPDLAGVGLLLEIAQAEDGARSRSSVLGHAHELLSDEMRQLRLRSTATNRRPAVAGRSRCAGPAPRRPCRVVVPPGDSPRRPRQINSRSRARPRAVPSSGCPAPSPRRRGRSRRPARCRR
jgi:hypothetical protein